MKWCHSCIHCCRRGWHRCNSLRTSNNWEMIFILLTWNQICKGFISKSSACTNIYYALNTISWIPSNIARLITEYNSMIQWYLSPLVLKHYVISAWRSPGFVDAWLCLWYWLVSLAQNFARTLNVDPGRFQWPFPHSGSISYWVGDLMIWQYLAIVPYCKFCLQLS